MEAGEGFLFLSIVLRSLLGLLLFLASSLILKCKRWREEDVTGREMANRSVIRWMQGVYTSRRFCRSFSLSLRIRCCSARSERRLSCTGDSILTGLKANLYPYVSMEVFTALTILSLRFMMSSSSFFLLTKWASINVWSSIRSFSILLRCISCRKRHPLVRLVLNWPPSNNSRQFKGLDQRKLRTEHMQRSKPCFPFTYIEVHLLSIWDLRGDEVGHTKWPGEEKSVNGTVEKSYSI